MHAAGHSKLTILRRSAVVAFSRRPVSGVLTTRGSAPCLRLTVSNPVVGARGRRGLTQCAGVRPRRFANSASVLFDFPPDCPAHVIYPAVSWTLPSVPRTSASTRPRGQDPAPARRRENRAWRPQIFAPRLATLQASCRALSDAVQGLADAEIAHSSKTPMK